MVVDHVLEFSDLHLEAPGGSSRLADTAPPRPSTRSRSNLVVTGRLMSRSVSTKVLALPPRKVLGRPILHGVSGQARTGQVLAITGPSGAGKTSLLDTLAGKTRYFSGQVTMDGKSMEESKSWHLAAYVQQDDALFPCLTVLETIEFAASLRLSQAVSKGAKKEHAKKVLQQLGLERSAHTRIGSDSQRGVSGGEKRRVLIACEIVHDPRILFLDEPTSGLDSVHACQVVLCCKDIARSGAIVLMTIHQPSSRILYDLDKLMVLSAGQVVFDGTLAHLEARVMALTCDVTPADLGNVLESFLQIVHDQEDSAEGLQRLLDLDVEVRQQEKEKQTAAAPSLTPKLSEKLWSIDAAGTKTVSEQQDRRQANGPLRELQLLAWRNFQNQIRTPELFYVRLAMMALLSVLVALILSHTDATPAGIRVTFSFYSISIAIAFFQSNDALPRFIAERSIFAKEARATTGIYRTSSYVIASAVTYIPFLVILALVYTLEVWWIAGLKGGAGGFFFFWLIMFLCFAAGNAFACLASAAVPNYTLGLFLVNGYTFGGFLLSGFFVPRDQLPKALVWLHYLSQFKYPYEALLQQHYGHVDCIRDSSDGSTGCLEDGQTVLETAGIGGLDKWACVAILSGIHIVYTVLFYVVLELRIRFNRL